MLITHKSTYNVQNIIADISNTPSNCNSITFDNCGEDDCVIYVNFTSTQPANLQYILLKAGKNIDFGGSIETIIEDTFTLKFVNNIWAATHSINIIRETFQILT